MNYAPYLIGGLMSAFFLFRLLPFLRARRMRGKPAPTLDGLIDAKYADRDRLLFYFTSPHCMMCRTVTPVVNSLAATHDNVITVDVSQSVELARKFGVMGTPTLVLVRDGKVERMLVGAKSESTIRALLD
jgi:thioredoxin 1